MKLLPLRKSFHKQNIPRNPPASGRFFFAVISGQAFITNGGPRVDLPGSCLKI
jgi:hypothetical protein